MKKVFLLLVVLFTAVSFTSCESDDSLPTIENKDDYYVKYIVKSQTIYNTSKIAEIQMDNYRIEKFTFNNGDWEMTIGPVKKGFNASCDARHDTSQSLARTYIDVEIHVKLMRMRP